MKILQVHNRYREPGGEDAVVAAEAELLRSSGLLVMQVDAENPHEAARTAGNLLLAPWNPLAAHRIRRAVESFEPDVAHVHNTWFSLSPSVVAALRAAGVPVVMTLHNFRLTCANAQLFRNGEPCELCVGTHPWHGVRYRCYRGSMVASASAATTIAVNRRLGTWIRSVTTFVALTQFAKSVMVRAGLPEHAIRVKPNFVPDPGPRRTRPSDSSEVLFVGRLSAEKGLGRALEAWREAAPADLHLVVVGDGPERASLEATAGRGVRFLGRLAPAQVQQRMLASRALLFPSRWYEGQPMVILEAFAAGLPVLGSDLGATAELLEETPDWRVASGSKGWHHALPLLQDRRAVNAAGAAVRGTYERSFTPEAAATRLRAIYEEAIASTPPANP